MKHPYFHKAVTEAYQNILAPDTIPAYFIFMETDPASIDINIHPTKTEIKFEDESAIWQILMASVRESLGRFNIVPSIDFENEALIDIPVRNTSDPLPQPPEIKINPEYNPFEKKDKVLFRPDFIDRFEKANTENWEKLYSTLEKENEDPDKFLRGTEENRKFIQIGNKYISCPVKSGIMLIDQKRAHERILYEKFLECLRNNIPVSQTELYPLTIELGPADYALLREVADDLKQLGLNIEFAGKNTIILKGRPSDSTSSDPVEMLEKIIEEYKSAGGDPAKGAREKLADAMAGSAAIQYGKQLTQSEMEGLFDSLFACSAPNYSPKGKPVINIITIEDLDRKFK
jgi:DNA mismatch repair protein MutL